MPSVSPTCFRNRLAGFTLAFGACLLSTFPATADDISECERTASGTAAVTACNRLILDNQSNVEVLESAFAGRARAYAGLGDHLAAIKDFDIVIKANPRIAEYFTERAHSHAALADWDSAIKDYTSAIAVNPDDVYVYFLRGNARAAKGYYSEALNDFGRAISDSKGDPPLAEYFIAYGRMALLTGRSADLNNAEGHLNRAVQLEPRNAEAFFVRAKLALSAKKSPQAESDLNAALSIQPDYATAYYERALLRAAQGDYRRAIADADSAIRIDDANAIYYTLRGVLAGALGERDRQIADYTKAIQSEPAVAARYTTRAWALLKANKPRAALRDIDRAILLGKMTPDMLVTRAEINAALGMKDKARLDYKSALLESPGLKAAEDGLRRLDRP